MVQERIPDDEYKGILEKMPICCVDVVIHHRNKVLLVYRNGEPAKSKWWFPGGRVYKNDGLEESAVRKANEEVGFKVQVERKIGVYENMFTEGPYDNFKSGVHTVSICFLVKPIDDKPKIKIDGTSSDYRWIDKIEENLDPFIKEVLRDARILN